MYKFILAFFAMLFAMLFAPESTIADESPPLGIEVSDCSGFVFSVFLEGKATGIIKPDKEREITYSERLHDMDYVAKVRTKDFNYTLAADSKASVARGTEQNNTISVRTVFNSSGGMPKLQGIAHLS